MKKFLFIILSILNAFNLFGNAGVFDGYGSNLTLSQSNDIQMQSEIVRITPLVNDKAITGGIENRLWADYKCEFILKNLSDKEVEARVGFPLAKHDNVRNYPLATQERDFKVCATSLTYKSIIKPYKFDYAKKDKDNNFRCLFYWDMKFLPKETLKLEVSYKLCGYYGVGTTDKNLRTRDWDNYTKKTEIYMNTTTNGAWQAFGYVTKTGNTWAGEIESAEFVLDTRAFEKKMNEGTVFELESRKKDKKDLVYMMSKGQWTRFLAPEFKEQADGVLVAKFAPFKPMDDFELIYHISVFPKDLEGLYEFFEYMEENGSVAKYGAFGEEQKRNLADIILAFYGVKVDNPKIEDFLKEQYYYESKFYPEIDEALKAKLLEISKTGNL